jgi:hypothetical protein
MYTHVRPTYMGSGAGFADVGPEYFMTPEARMQRLVISLDASGPSTVVQLKMPLPKVSKITLCGGSIPNGAEFIGQYLLINVSNVPNFMDASISGEADCTFAAYVKAEGMNQAPVIDGNYTRMFGAEVNPSRKFDRFIFTFKRASDGEVVSPGPMVLLLECS